MQQTSMFPDADISSLPSLNLRKATGAVHIRNDVTVFQRKLMTGLYFAAFPQLGDFSVLSHTIALPALSKLVGFNSNNIAYLKENLDSLVGTRIHWNIQDKNEEEWGVAALLADVKIRGSMITYSLSPALRKKLVESSHYALVDMRKARLFKSKAGLALWENCLPYQAVGQTPFFELDLLRDLLGAQGESYDEFKVLNRAILKTAAEEVNQHSDFKVEYVFKRERRQVKQVKILISHPDGTKDDARDVYDEVLVDELHQDFCLTLDQVSDLLNAYDIERIRPVMEYVGEKYTRGEIKKGKIAPYFLSTIKYWKPPAPAASRLDQKRDEVEALRAAGETRKASAEQRKVEQEQRAQELKEFRKAEALRRLEALTVDERVALDAKFEEYVRTHHEPVLRMYQDKGVEHSMIKGIFNQFLQATLLESLEAETV